mgnify:CR=1 FL=1
MNSPPQTTLEGIRVIDLGRYQAGPRCGLMFSRLGADVIKVESVEGDESRQNGPIVNGQSVYWVQYNSGKRSLSLNLRADRGKGILRDLIKVSDVLIQNFRPGVIEEIGFGYDALHKINPGIIMVNVSAYGQYGPYSDRVGFDTIGQALGGLMSLTGFPGSPPVKTHFPLIDRITSLHATIGALSALIERGISGVGQSIDVCLADTGFTVNEIPISAYLADGSVEQREGNGRGLTNAYRTCDGWVYLHASTEAMWGRFCKAIGRIDLMSDTRFYTALERRNHLEELETEIAAWFSDMDTVQAVELLSSHSVPAAPINGVEQAAVDPHLHERDVLVETTDPLAGRIHVAGKMIKFSRTPMVVGSAPTVGQHTKEILSEVLGYSSQTIEALCSDGVVNTG